MNRSFRAPEKVMPGTAAVKQRQQQMTGSFRKSVKEKEEELGLFLEMRKREKERNNLLQNSEEFDSSLGSIEGCSPMFGMPAATPARKTGADEFLNSENDKNDYDWLLTPPGTPLFPSLESESQKPVMGQIGTPKARPTALKSRLSNTHPHLETNGRNNMTLSRQPLSSPGLNTSSGGPRRPTSSSGPGSRPATPTGRPATPTGRPTLSAPSRPGSNSNSNSVPKTTTRPTRSSTPTPRSSTMGPTKPTLPARSSTPTPRSTPRSSTPTRGPTPRAPTPTRRPPPTLTKPVTKPVPNTRNVGAPPQQPQPPPPRASSPTVKRPWKPQEMPGYTLDAPPNLRTSLSDRPTSATRGRPMAVSRSTSVEPVVNGRVRRQSCSPSRGRLPTGVSHMSGSSVPVPALNRAYAKANDNLSPGLYGTKMVERVINMRKLVPPKKDDKHSPHSNLSAKSSSPDSSGFGRSLSKKSLDMAIRHMDIRRTVPGNLRPLMSNIPASSMYSVRGGAGPTRSRTMSVCDSPSSNGSSEMSVNNNNNGVWLDGNIDDEISSLVRGR
ncbi:uncharacterized protein LOC111919722 [Lactuca sativa]|uniref:Uncharacterized protein n=1 Tax=Lactuca sativa TaxID=4236 RepID=A0A9R1WVC5_LACSA|nr:uncharacterized protein LOC111919722 [Lactuca sativa]KAJ0188961.1 hypothetical protein LSAT_V11C800394450 [Lactuca sativa]